MARRAVAVAGRPVAGVAGLLLAATACSGAGEQAPAPDPAALRACQEVFGAESVGALRDAFGEGFRPHGRAPGEVEGRLVAQAREWRAGADDLRRQVQHPCEIEGGGDGRVITATVGWSMYDIDHVSSGKGRFRWRTVADGVYVASRPDVWGTPLVMPCTVPGTAPGQGAELPLEVAVLHKASGEAAEVPEERLLAALARSARELLGCREQVKVPDDLLP
ncbi:hypothetical protein [Streptomyces sp.]|uniref:hypothetical protein n=1 Tax=Streptomyces sp. TaxID=1931 RepID=UPI00281194FC|nr:hypothetical protein [Streptomyces sp.]